TSLPPLGERGGARTTKPDLHVWQRAYAPQPFAASEHPPRSRWPDYANSLQFPSLLSKKNWWQFWEERPECRAANRVSPVNNHPRNGGGAPPPPRSNSGAGEAASAKQREPEGAVRCQHSIAPSPAQFILAPAFGRTRGQDLPRFAVATRGRQA